uniref:Calcitonin receptor n=2 Tax=Nothobranchius kuhntae TaxID=321403 RepID=A0A1A8J1F2_NOTKU
MWRSLTLLVAIACSLGTKVSQSQDVEPSAAAEKPEEMQENFSDLSVLLGDARRQILASQFECYLRMINDPPRTDEGPYCNRTWDGWLCWGDSAPGSHHQYCPSYYADFDPEEKVVKVCNPDGQWFRHPESNRIWTNYSQCSIRNEKFKFAMSMYYLALVGHGLSIISLIISLVIFSYLNSLSCQRISLHKNTFLSFILNSIVTIMWLSVSVANNKTISSSNPVSCKILAVLTQYTFMSNYFWMLCEGIYLHTLIIVAVFVEEQQLFWYYILGWGFPIIPAITYAIARGLFYNDECWISPRTNLVHITHGPIQVALLANLFFLLNIVRVLITKLKETHCAESMTYMKAVRATLILVPLLGIPFILLPWRPEGRISQTVYDFFMSLFTSFQGLLVAIIFCFCNAEAQTALRRKWLQWKSAWGKTGWGQTPTTNNHCSSHTNSSIVETSRAIGHGGLEHLAPTSSFQLTRTAKQHKTNGQERTSKACTNGQVDIPNTLESPTWRPLTSEQIE